MSNGNGFSGVSNCYVFKSRLQEYAQKAGIATPVYETVKEGPSHEPNFRSTVTVNNVRYDSLPGFFNRKAAEQSAAEIALVELLKSGNMTECIPHPVHETGLCKNLLQEYAQKMNYAIPSYICNKQAVPGKQPYSCTVEIGGIQYIGAAAKTKKEAEIKAARTALLAIQSNACAPVVNPDGRPPYTVVPCKKKGRESDTRSEATKPLKPKKGEFKKRWKRRFHRNRGERSKMNQNEQGNVDKENGSGAPDSLMSVANEDSHNAETQVLDFNQNGQGIWNGEGASDVQMKDLEISSVEKSKYTENGMIETAKFGQNGPGMGNGGDIGGTQIPDLAVSVLGMVTNKVSQDGYKPLEVGRAEQEGGVAQISHDGYDPVASWHIKQEGQLRAQISQDEHPWMEFDVSQPASEEYVDATSVTLTREDGNGISTAVNNNEW
ncbi:double-stranded RNA-binding protein 8-like [Magnolia sinica]|uniref:double-stranded RNA-binding protein 8-like n=1 Tax=Magnolia sinica TaxID=86752 RepID=UPI002657DB04|nr:double-stranded RNA-binding protein 8-like [Magnolia sinica]